MAAEAETSASHNAAHSFQHHLQLHRPHIFYPADITSSNPHNEKRSSQRHSDNNSMDKLISVDEFDDSDDEDIRSCSTVSPTPSDNTINGNYSGPYSSVGGSSNSNHKLRKRGVVPSKVLDETELQSLRLKINSRERKRMHDLNSALDGLREVMPYAHGPSVRKLSKIATLLLARNYILTLNSSLEEMKKLVNDIYHNPGTTSRRVSSQMTQRSSIPTSVAVSSSGNVAETSKNSENSASNLHCKSTQPTSKASEPLSVFAHPSTNHMSPLSAQPPVQPLLPLSIPALRASLSGLTPHDINALVSACTLPKCDGGSTPAVPQTFPGQVHLLSRLPAPCACAQCLSGASHFPPSLQLGRFCHPLFTSSAFLHRKN